MSEFRVVSTELFYNSIAKDYNSLMTDSDNRVRAQVKELFQKFVIKGTVLDFGGGTGLDLPWLAVYEKVFFLEPSEAMRSVAKSNSAELHANNKITIVENNTSIDNWTNDRLPFSEKVDGVLMNFCVMNCIENPSLLFERLSLICKPSCPIVITIINPQLKSVIKTYSLKDLITLIFRGRFTTQARHGELQQQAFVYSTKTLIGAAEKYFEYRTYVPLNSSNFGVLILSTK